MKIKLNKLGPVALATAFTPNKKSHNPAVGGTDGTKPRVLIPGINPIPDAEWALLKDNPIIKTFMEEDDEGRVILKVIEEPKNDGKPESDDLSEYTVDQARKMIRQTLNRPLLEQWLAAESRATVNAALTKQLDKLIVKIEKKEDAA